MANKILSARDIIKILSSLPEDKKDNPAVIPVHLDTGWTLCPLSEIVLPEDPCRLTKNGKPEMTSDIIIFN